MVKNRLRILIKNMAKKYVEREGATQQIKRLVEALEGTKVEDLSRNHEGDFIGTFRDHTFVLSYRTCQEYAQPPHGRDIHQYHLKVSKQGKVVLEVEGDNYWNPSKTLERLYISLSSKLHEAEEERRSKREERGLRVKVDGILDCDVSGRER